MVCFDSWHRPLVLLILTLMFLFVFQVKDELWVTCHPVTEQSFISDMLPNNKSVNKFYECFDNILNFTFYLISKINAFFLYVWSDCSFLFLYYKLCLTPSNTMFYIHTQGPYLYFQVLLNRFLLSFMQDVFCLCPSCIVTISWPAEVSFCRTNKPRQLHVCCSVADY